MEPAEAQPMKPEASPSTKKRISTKHWGMVKKHVTHRFAAEGLKPTATDAPLQRAITTLKSIGAALEAEGKTEEAAGVLRVIELLASQSSRRKSAPATEYDALLKGADKMEAAYIRHIHAEDAAAAEASSTTKVSAEQHSALTSRVMKWTRKVPRLALGDNAAKLSHMLEHEVSDWQLDINEVQTLSGGHALVALGWALFERHGLRAKLDLRTDTVLSFLLDVESGYKESAVYHGAVHGADVTHALHHLLCSSALQCLTKDDPLLLFAALLAAIVHDLGHDGFNNAFHVNTNSQLAVTACYEAPLERHHLASAFQVLAKPHSILSGLALAERKQVQAWMRDFVLATDMAVNLDVINAFRAMLEMKAVVGADGAPPPPVAPAAQKKGRRGSVLGVVQQMVHHPPSVAETLTGDERLLAIKMVLKVGDLGYVSKGQANCLLWTERCFQEFFTQGDEEKRLGLPVSMLCDRDDVQMPSCQLGFYKFLVLPLYEALHLLVPMEEQLANLESMRAYWQQKKDDATKDAPA